jgi:hypothetical protein
VREGSGPGEAVLEGRWGFVQELCGAGWCAASFLAVDGSRRRWEALLPSKAICQGWGIVQGLCGVLRPAPSTVQSSTECADEVTGARARQVSWTYCHILPHSTRAGCTTVSTTSRWTHMDLPALHCFTHAS